MPAPAIRTALHTSALRLPWHRADAGAAIERAFAQQYERHHQAIYRYCRSIVRDEHEAQDILQTTMAKALEAMRAGTLTGDIRPWLFRVAHNEAISTLRRSTQVVEPGAHDELGGEDLARRVDDRAAIAQLKADLDDLAERPRTALVLREFSGLSHDEIAGILNTTPGAVKQSIFEARRALLDCQAGRAMSCDEIQRTLSDQDGRITRSRKIRAHVRDCAACTAFLAAMEERPRQLALLAPALPAAAGTTLLGHLLGAGHAASGLGGTAAGASAGASLASTAGLGSAGSAVATSVGLKVAAVVAATAVATGGGAVIVPERESAKPETQQQVRDTSSPEGMTSQPNSATAAPSTGAINDSRAASHAATERRSADEGATTPPRRADAPGAASTSAQSAEQRSNGKNTGQATAADAREHRTTGQTRAASGRDRGSSTKQPAKASQPSKSTTQGKSSGSAGNSGAASDRGSASPPAAAAPAPAAPETAKSGGSNEKVAGGGQSSAATPPAADASDSGSSRRALPTP